MSLKGMKMLDYHHAISRFCADNSDLTIFLAGEISHPGISDLDFVVLDEEPVISKSVEPFLAGGNVLLMPSKLMKHMGSLENFELKQLQGKPYQTPPPPVEFSIVEILEWLPERILKCADYAKAPMPIQHAYLLQKSIGRSISNVEKLLGKKYDYMTADEFRSSRNMSPKNVISECANVGSIAWSDFEVFLRDNEILKGHAYGSVRINEYYSFNDKFNSLMLYFNILGESGTSLGEKLKSKTSINVLEENVSEHFRSFILDRWNILDEVYTWFIKNKFSKGMIKYGWLLNE